MTDELLARPGLDFGIPTDNGVEVRRFYEEVIGLPFLKIDEIMEGHHEVFHTLHGSWLKINTSADPLKPAVTGYRELLVADRSAGAVVTHTDPDGLAVTVVPPGHRGVEEVGLVMVVNDLDAQVRFLRAGLGAEPVGDGFRVGNTVIFLTATDDRIDPTPIYTRGLTMLTLVVRDIPSAHQRVLDAGASHGLRVAEDPAVPGRCLFSFVRDPNGNWIELVQFSDISGPLPAVDTPPPTVEEFLGFRDHGIPA